MKNEKQKIKPSYREYVESKTIGTQELLNKEGWWKDIDTAKWGKDKWKEKQELNRLYNRMRKAYKIWEGERIQYTAGIINLEKEEIGMGVKEEERKNWQKDKELMKIEKEKPIKKEEWKWNQYVEKKDTYWEKRKKLEKGQRAKIRKRREEAEKKRKVMKEAMIKETQKINRGLAIELSGRISGVDMAKKVTIRGRKILPQNLKMTVDYTQKGIKTKWGTWGMKIIKN